MATTKGKALIIVAEGAEEMETVITADVLRRGKVNTEFLYRKFIYVYVLIKGQCITYSCHFDVCYQER